MFLPDFSSHRYSKTAATLRAGGEAAPVELGGALVVVDCEVTSRKLLEVAGGLWKGALQWVNVTLIKLAGKEWRRVSDNSCGIRSHFPGRSPGDVEIRPRPSDARLP